jgi:hypothetical protein
MQPFDDGDPLSSWRNCPARFCPQIHDGALWKCAPLAYLPTQDEKFGLGAAWRRYLVYKPLQPGCSDAEFNAFFARGTDSSRAGRNQPAACAQRTRSIARCRCLIWGSSAPLRSPDERPSSRAWNGCGPPHVADPLA